MLVLGFPLEEGRTRKRGAVFPTPAEKAKGEM